MPTKRRHVRFMHDSPNEQARLRAQSGHGSSDEPQDGSFVDFAEELAHMRWLPAKISRKRCDR